ncbi:MAG: universal stress protein [Streptomyces sp.]|nr:universal stress protein [Streptomyces sp.]
MPRVDAPPIARHHAAYTARRRAQRQERLLSEAVERARTAEPEMEVSYAVVAGEPLTVLEAEARTAELVVVGSRGMGGFAGLLAGSTAAHLAAHGRCPVLVVREEAPTDGPVVVGVDGSPAGEEAVDFACAGPGGVVCGSFTVAVEAGAPASTATVLMRVLARSEKERRSPDG